MNEVTTELIITNLEKIRLKMQHAAEAVGRDPAGIQLVVVSKGQPVEVIRAAYEAGVRIYGENYPQETEEKINHLVDLEQVEWHMIGHLQSRKAPIIARHFQLIHSLDSVHLAVKLDKLLEVEGKILPALLEVNVGGEATKTGWDITSDADQEFFVAQIPEILHLQHLEIRGLMTMPPLYENPEDARPLFKSVRLLRDRLENIFSTNSWKVLSMGTSADFPVAIQEGATMVRIGQAVLGPRPLR